MTDPVPGLRLLLVTLIVMTALLAAGVWLSVVTWMP
jgi:hypothetical protein